MRLEDVNAADFDDFYRANRERCLRAALASGVGSDRAEEAVAEAFARAWARWDKVSQAQSPTAWVVRTAVNANISGWRRRRREQLGYHDPTDVSEPSTPIESGARLDLIQAVRGLPPRQRDVVVLRYLLDLDIQTAAGWLQIAPGTVRALTHQAMTALRAQTALRQEYQP